MIRSAQTAALPLRMDAEELRNRLDSGEPATILDARAPKAWEASNVKVRGAVRVSPDQFRTDALWPRDRLTVVY